MRGIVHSFGLSVLSLTMLTAVPAMAGLDWPDVLREKVEACWADAASLGGEAVTVRFSLHADARPLAETFEQLGTAPDATFEAARAAVLKCAGADGYALPVDQFMQWRDVEMGFGPDGRVAVTGETKVNGAVRPKLPSEVAPLPELDMGKPMAQAETVLSALSDEDRWVPKFRTRVTSCWNTGALEQPVAVTVQFEMHLTGKPKPESFELVSHGPAAQADVDLAYAAAVRAVRRCTPETGYDLPEAQYERWRMIEINFDPEGMVTR